ncbi:alcohol dehydrogenase catalytic domain-containing protein [Paenibacillus macerans]|uniref:alcohol dehydrogenase catalytic domain-containing protein n=1 Tax=Paenibacillus TaxID=44249 RepID=UPI0035309433
MLVRIVYAAVIPLDYIPGFYASGVVEEVGQDVTEFKPGDRRFLVVSKGPMQNMALRKPKN